MKEIATQKKWVYTLYKTDEGMHLSVTYGVAMLNVGVLLSVSQAKKDESFINTLAEKIRNNPNQNMPSK
jgi:hypothetical protein